MTTVVVHLDAARRQGLEGEALLARLNRLTRLGLDVVVVDAGSALAVDGRPRPSAFRDAQPEAQVVVDGSGGGAASLLAMLDAVAESEEGFPQPVSDPAWTIEVPGAPGERESSVESWLTVANGRSGTRGALEEDRPDASAEVYVAGVFADGDGHQPEPLRGPRWTRLRPQLDGEDVSLEVGDTVEHRRVLDLRQGIVFREWRQRLPSGVGWHFRSARFASLAQPELLALEVVATADAGAVSLDAAVGPPPPQGGVDQLTERTAEGATVVSLSSRRGGAARFELSTSEHDGRLTRTTVVHRSWADRTEQASGPLPAGDTAAWTELRTRHRAAWRERWRHADVVVRGDPEAQRALRFALYHLISSGEPHGDAASVGARGLTGPGYGGHVFWDTEVFVLPFFVWTHPPTARALLSYRYRTLPAARAKAARLGFRGALYAWESADTGEDVTPSWGLLPDGTPLRIHTGDHEQHISADVAWAAWLYWTATRDEAFLLDMGAEIILETARFWGSRARRGADGRHHIDGVIGPDEYHENVDDNAFTNVLARWNLERAIELFDLLPELDRRAWDGLVRRLGLQPDEPRCWREVALGLADGFDPDTQLYEQFAGFDSYEDVCAAELAERPFVGESVLGVDRLRASQVVKQADVVMLTHMLPEVVGPAAAAANYRHYEPRTSHGSSLSPAIHAAVAARVGRLDEALGYFRLAGGVDLDDRMGNAAKGVHIATMGGLWQAAVMGFGGVRADGDALRLDPRIPPQWETLAFPVTWRGTRVEVEADAEALRLHVDGPAEVALAEQAPAHLDPGSYLARRQGGRWSSLERHAVDEGASTA